MAEYFNSDTQVTLDAARGPILDTLFLDPISSLLTKVVSWLHYCWISARFEKYRADDAFLKRHAGNAFLLADLELLKRYLDAINELKDLNKIASILGSNPALLRIALFYHLELQSRFSEQQLNLTMLFKPYLANSRIQQLLIAFRNVWIPKQGAFVPSTNAFALSPFNIFLSATLSGGILGGQVGFLIAGPVGAIIGAGAGATALTLLGFIHKHQANKRFLALNPHAGGDPVPPRSAVIGSQTDNPLLARLAMGVVSGVILGACAGTVFPVVGTVIGALAGASAMGLAAVLSPFVVRPIARLVARKHWSKSLLDEGNKTQDLRRYWDSRSILHETWYQRQLSGVTGGALLGALTAAVVSMVFGAPVVAASVWVLGALIGASAGALTSYLMPLLASVNEKVGKGVFALFIALVLTGILAGIGVSAVLLGLLTGPLLIPVLSATVIPVAVSSTLLVFLTGANHGQLIAKSAVLDQPLLVRVTSGLIVGAALGAAVGVFVPVVGPLVMAFAGAMILATLSLVSGAHAMQSASTEVGSSLANPFFPRLAINSVWGGAFGLGIGMLVLLASGPIGAAAAGTLMLSAAIGVFAGALLHIVVGDALPAPATPGEGSGVDWIGNNSAGDKPKRFEPAPAHLKSSSYAAAGSALQTGPDGETTTTSTPQPQPGGASRTASAAQPHSAGDSTQYPLPPPPAQSGTGAVQYEQFDGDLRTTTHPVTSTSPLTSTTGRVGDIVYGQLPNMGGNTGFERVDPQASALGAMIGAQFLNGPPVTDAVMGQEPQMRPLFTDSENDLTPLLGGAVGYNSSNS